MSAVHAERKRAPVRADGTPRDLTVTALILGVAGALWFGWGQAQPPAGWGLPLSVGTFGGLVLVAAAVTSLWRALRRGQPGREPRARAEGEGGPGRG
jgi:hypothetical protein